jgi:2-methylisocitrate lyase-like PEP mutase family enzyme
MTLAELAPRRAVFRKLHEAGCFVIPNPWDVGTARYCRHLGFRALATTSAGLAFLRGLPDTDWAVPLDMVLAHVAEIVDASDLPVNADFESGYASEPEAVGENVRLCVETGVAGLSIEDATGNRGDHPLYELPLAVDRIKASRAAIDATGTGVLLTARAECFLVGHPDPLRESVRRLQAYAEAGADVLYAPGTRDKNQIQTIISEVRPKPVNILMGANLGIHVADLAEWGARRISVGSSLSRAAWTGFLAAARQIAEQGSFAGFDGITPYAELNGFFREDWKSRK